MSASSDSPQQVAVWYFVAATFVFAFAAMYAADVAGWLRVTAFVIGLVLVVAGGVQLGRELNGRRRESR